MSGGGRRWLSPPTPSIQLEGMRGATSSDGVATSGVGCFSNRQSHSPSDPNPLRTDWMLRDFFARLNGFRMGDALTVAEQPCVSGRSLELRYKYATLGEPLLQELFREPDGIGAASHRGRPSPLRGLRL